MNFFTNLTITGIIGLILLIAGALVTFLSTRFTAHAQGKYANLIVKCVGLAVVVTGFVLIMFI